MIQSFAEYIAIQGLVYQPEEPKSLESCWLMVNSDLHFELRQYIYKYIYKFIPSYW